ncbi:MAG: peptide-methionine (R)-S-oxide reductase MsrB [Myxococcota bacterium]|nr:peptide-methionine (R)-S-oxide reductase MsrB [Myxococcota bacterium]
MAQDPAQDPKLDATAIQDATWQQLLSPTEYRILRHAATEPAGTGRYLDNEEAGMYHCAGCGQALYTAQHKFHSGCGWPSFFDEVTPGAVRTYRDTSHGRIRTEMRCSRCDGHLGHIFQDAPQTPTGTRHCVNGYAVVFVPEGSDVQEVLSAHRARQAEPEPTPYG